MIPQAEIRDLIVELRSATAGVGTFKASFDHLAELTGKLADQAIERARGAGGVRPALASDPRLRDLIVFRRGRFGLRRTRDEHGEKQDRC